MCQQLFNIENVISLKSIAYTHLYCIPLKMFKSIISSSTILIIFHEPSDDKNKRIYFSKITHAQKMKNHKNEQLSTATSIICLKIIMIIIIFHHPILPLLKFRMSIFRFQYKRVTIKKGKLVGSFKI